MLVLNQRLTDWYDASLIAFCRNCTLEVVPLNPAAVADESASGPGEPRVTFVYVALSAPSFDSTVLIALVAPAGSFSLQYEYGPALSVVASYCEEVV